MAASSTIASSSFLRPTLPSLNKSFLLQNHCCNGKLQRRKVSFRVQAAKLPAGVELPKVEPQFKAPFLGFTKTAEVWNSRACMIGIIGVFIVESIINKGILQVIGIDVGKGLDLPL